MHLSRIIVYVFQIKHRQLYVYMYIYIIVHYLVTFVNFN